MLCDLGFDRILNALTVSMEEEREGGIFKKSQDFYAWKYRSLDW
jgi:hypothetical protein